MRITENIFIFPLIFLHDLQHYITFHGIILYFSLVLLLFTVILITQESVRLQISPCFILTKRNSSLQSHAVSTTVIYHLMHNASTLLPFLINF